MSGFKLKLSLLVCCLLPLLVGLGVWQLSRYQDKQTLEKMYDERRQLPPFPLSKLDDYPDPLYLPVEVTGRFDTAQYFLLDNQVWQGQVGYELIMPLQTSDGQWLLVDRGWIPMSDRSVLPEITTNRDLQVIQGITYRSFGKPFLLSEDHWSPDWPKRIQAVNFQRMRDALGYPIPALTLVMNPGQSDAKRMRPLTLNMKSDKHLAYAFQWFAMAIVLLGLYLYRMRSGGRSNNNNSRRSE